jgi:hypothetical protein
VDRANQFDLTVKTARHPVVVNLVALRATLDIVATVLIVQVAILHAKHRARMGKLVRRHIDWMLPGAVTAVIDLTYSINNEPESVSAPKIPCAGQSWTTQSRKCNVVSVVVDATKLPPVTSKPFEDVVV